MPGQDGTGRPSRHDDDDDDDDDNEDDDEILLPLRGKQDNLADCEEDCRIFGEPLHWAVYSCA